MPRVPQQAGVTLKTSLGRVTGNALSVGAEEFLGVPFAQVPSDADSFTRELRPWTRFSLAKILVLAGGAIPPAPAVPASTRISARLQRARNTVHP